MINLGQVVAVRFPDNFVLIQYILDLQFNCRELHKYTPRVWWTVIQCPNSLLREDSLTFPQCINNEVFLQVNELFVQVSCGLLVAKTYLKCKIGMTSDY